MEEATLEKPIQQETTPQPAIQQPAPTEQPAEKPKNPLYEEVRCDLCGQDNYVVVYRGTLKEAEGPAPKKADELYKSSGSNISEDTIVKCRNCDLCYVNPRLKGEKIIEGYSQGQDSTFISQVRGREKTFLNGIKYIEKFTKPGKILDIGTAGGSFLHVAKQRGWQVYGVEPNKWLSEWAWHHYGIHVQPGTIDDLNYPEEFFDVITLWDVIEHVPDPSEVLKKCHRLLKPGGMIYLNYPDYGSNAAKLMRSKWVFLLSVHIFYFTRPTIAKMLEKTNYKVLSYRSHWQTLNLGYLISRMEPYSKPLYKLGNTVVGLLRLKNLPFKYQLGQTGVIAVKK